MLPAPFLSTPTALAAAQRAGAVRGPVLLATDGDAPTDATARVARSIADRFGLPIEALSVLQPLPTYVVGFDIPVLPPDFEETRRADTHAVVTRRLEPVLGPHDRWHLDLRYGDAGRLVPDAARECGAGMIVVGAGGHGVFDRLLGHEVALHVVRHAQVPVLAVAPQQAGPIRRAVVGVDFSAASIRAAQTALALLEPAVDRPELLEGSDRGRAVLTLVHVRSVMEHLPVGAASWDVEYVANVAAMFERLRELLRPYAPAGVTIETRIRSGGVVECLRDAVRESGADLVAVGTHGPGWVERLFVGSVATDALRHLGITVLVAPAPPAEERVRLELGVSGQVTLDQSEDWAGALDVFSRRNAGRRARLEVSGPALDGLMGEAAGFRFQGATYDVRDGRLEIMLDDAREHTRHLTHGVSHVRSLDIVGESDAADRALLVDFPGGEAVLTFTG